MVLTDNLIFSTPISRLGKHEWRMIVYEKTDYTGKPVRLTEYQWRPVFQTWGDTRWQSEEKWPRYNGNDGTHAGCPKSLARIYRTHQPAIESALANKGE